MTSQDKEEGENDPMTARQVLVEFYQQYEPTKVRSCTAVEVSLEYQYKERGALGNHHPRTASREIWGPIQM